MSAGLDNASRVKAALDVRAFYREELGKYKPANREHGWVNARCPMPGHEDKNPSFGVNLDTGRYRCQSCDANGRDAFDFLQARYGMTFKDALKNLADRCGVSLEDDRRQEAKPKPKAKERAAIVATYPYENADGSPRIRTLRDANKNFLQQRADGKGGWLWGLGDVEPVLYHLPDVLEAAALGKPIFVVEGEKDADNLAALGVTATTCAMGAGKWREEYTESLEGATAIVLPDNDSKGRKHAKAVAASCHKLGVPAKIIELPGLPDKGDVSDWIEAGGTIEALWALIEKAPLAPVENEDSGTLEAEDNDGDGVSLTHWEPADVAHMLGNEAPERQWIFEGSIAAGDLAGISAVGGAGKTWLALMLAASKAAGRAFLQPFPTTEPEPVLMFCGEDGPPIIHGRLRALAQHYDLTGNECRLLKENLILYCGVSEPLTAMTAAHGVVRTARFAWLEREVAKRKPRLIVLDPKIRWDGCEENDAASTTAFVVTLQDLIGEERACVCLHHVSKQAGHGTGSEAARGSTAWRDGVRWHAGLARLEERELARFGLDPESREFVRLEVSKANYAPQRGPVYFRRGPMGVLEDFNPKDVVTQAVVDFIAAAIESSGPLPYRDLRRGQHEVFKDFKTLRSSTSVSDWQGALDRALKAGDFVLRDERPKTLDLPTQLNAKDASNAA